MLLRKVLSERTITIVEDCPDKWGLIRLLVDSVVRSGGGKDADALYASVVDRERKVSTGLQKGIAAPHARTSGVEGLVAALAICPEGVDFDSLDGRPSRLVFLVLSAPSESTRYLKALADVAAIGTNAALVEALAAAKSPADAIRLIDEMCGNGVSNGM